MLKKSRIQFENPELKKLFFQENLDFDTNGYEGIKLAGNTRIRKNVENNSAKVQFNLAIGEKDKKFPFSLVIEMESEFVWEEEMSDQDVNDLLKINAPSLLLGYMRPIVANITGMTKYPAFNIPFLDMRENEAEFEE